MKSVIKPFRTLTLSQKRKLKVYISLLILNSILDILGVLALGLLVLQTQDVLVQSTSSTTSLLNWALPSNYLEFSQNESLLLLIVLSLLFFLVKALAAPYLHRELLIFLGGVSTNFSRDLTYRLFSQDIIFSKKRTTQETAYILTSGSFYTFQGILGFFALSISELVIIIGITFLLLLLDLLLTLFIIAYFSLVLFFLNRFLKKTINKQNRILNDASIGANTAVQENLNSYREVFVNQKIESLVKNLVGNLQDSITARASLTWATLLPKYILDVSLILGIAIVGIFAYVYHSLEEAVTLIGFFLLGASRIMPSLLRFNSGLQGVQNCSEASNLLFNLVHELDNADNEKVQRNSVLPPHATQEVLINVDCLNFKYEGTTELVLEDLSFQVRTGEFLAVVGPSGSGKSTLVDLLIGVIDDPTSSIHIGDTTPREHVRSFPGLIGYVPQDVSLFNRSLLENIALGVPQNQINHMSIDRAVARAALTDLVHFLPLGLNTVVGERGHNFSGGQKQRIGLARAFYSDPKILIMDEATSALDAETEYQISQMLSSFAGDLTLIVVAHRLATVQKADRVLYLGGAGFSAVGSFEELRIRVPNFDIQAKLLGI